MFKLNYCSDSSPMLGIRIRMFLDFQNLDLLTRDTGMDPDPVDRILLFSQKGFERNEIMLAKQNFNTKF